VAENELQQMQELADNLVQQAMLNQPNHAQESETVSSEVLDFLRAQGAPIRMEVPMLCDRQSILPHLTEGMDIEDDYPIIQMANALGLHPGYGPLPSAHMLLQDILWTTMTRASTIQVPRPVALGLSQFVGSLMLQCSFTSSLMISYSEFPESFRNQILQGMQPVVETLHFHMVDRDMAFLMWGNNMEASSSKGKRLLKVSSGDSRPLSVGGRLSESSQLSTLHNQEAINSIIAQLQVHCLLDLDYVYPQMELMDWLLRDVYLPQSSSTAAVTELPVEHEVSDSVQESHLSPLGFGPSREIVCSSRVLDAIIVGQENETQYVQPVQAIPPGPPKKRKNRTMTTPIVDDEVHRNTRKHQLPGFEHMELDEKNKPRPRSSSMHVPRKDTVSMLSHKSQLLMEEL